MYGMLSPVLIRIKPHCYIFSAVRSPIELKLGGDLGLVSQISVLWFQDSIVFHIVNKQTNKKNAEIAKNAVLENLSFLHRSKSD
jgi:hypothetical protein